MSAAFPLTEFGKAEGKPHLGRAAVGLINGEADKGGDGGQGIRGTGEVELGGREVF